MVTDDEFCSLDKSRQPSFRCMVPKDNNVDNSALLFAGEECLWLLVQECGDAKLGAEVLLGPSSRVGGGPGLFGHQWRSGASGGTG